MDRFLHELRNASTIEPCEDAISREDAIDTFIAWEKREFGYSDLNRGERFISAIETLPSVSPSRPIGEWIPCSERLPERQGYYICTCKDGSKYKRATVVKWSNGWQLTGARAYWVVLAWMPLPKPWKGADGKE